MANRDMRSSAPLRLPFVAIGAIGEWLLVLPATLLLAATALRQLGGRGLPARMSGVVSEWVTTHVSRLGAAVLFIGMPGVAVIIGCAAILRIWREDPAIGHDAAAVLAMLRRHLAVGLLATATLLAGAILAAVAAHIVTD